MKTDKNFKLHKKYKRRLALMPYPQHIRSLWKKSFIEMALAEEEYKRSRFVKDKGE